MNFLNTDGNIGIDASNFRNYAGLMAATGVTGAFVGFAILRYKVSPPR